MRTRQWMNLKLHCKEEGDWTLNIHKPFLYLLFPNCPFKHGMKPKLKLRNQHTKTVCMLVHLLPIGSSDSKILLLCPHSIGPRVPSKSFCPVRWNPRISNPTKSNG